MIGQNLRTWMVASLLAASAATGARSQPAGIPAQTGADGGAVSARTPIDEASAEETREKLREVLRRYPPDLGRVLKLDPALMTNESYMTAYPALHAFLAHHPEVARTPDFYLQSVWIPSEKGPDSAAVELWENMLGGLGGLLVFGVVTTVLVWLVKTIIEQRRWNRLSKVQTEVHGKLLDRFASNEDLLAYMQTSSGKRFLEAAPISVDASPSRGVSAPVGRILWSVQAGVVLSTLGIGLQLVSRHVVKEVAPPLFVMGVVALSIGVGFVVSAIVAYALSRRLGLLEPSRPALKGEESGSAPA